MSYFKNLKWEMVLYSILCIVMGILMLVYPGTILNTICDILAVVFILLGIRYLMEYKRKDIINAFYKYELVVGAIFLLAAVFVIVKRGVVISIIPLIVGIIIVISGVMKLENALDLRRMGNHWIPLLVLAGINVLLGIMILANPQATAIFVTRVTGGVLVYSGVVDFITTLTVSARINKWMKSNAVIDVDAVEIDDRK